MHWSRRAAKHRKGNRNSGFKLFLPARCLSSAEKKDLEKITIFIDKHRILSVEFLTTVVKIVQTALETEKLEVRNHANSV